MNSATNADSIVTRHNGDPLTAEQDFIVAPPAEIGEIVTADTTLRPKTRPLHPVLRNALIFVPAIGITAWFVYDWIVGISQPQPQRAPAYLTMPLWAYPVAVLVLSVPGVILGWVIAHLTRFHHTSTFTGTLGIARCTLRKSRQGPSVWAVLPFSTVQSVRTGQTVHTYEGVYTGTSYQYTWHDAAGRKLYKLTGRYRSKVGTPKAKDPYWFAAAAENAWNSYAFEKMKQQFEIDGYVDFPITAKETIRVHPGALEIVRKSGSVRISNEEIKTLSLSAGQFHIAHKDARWFSNQGKFTFNYATMPNGRLLLLNIEMLLGRSFV